MKLYSWCLGVVIALAGCAPSPPVLDTGGWRQDERQTRLAQMVVSLLTRNNAHYRQKPLDASLVQETSQGFVHHLDPDYWILHQGDREHVTTQIMDGLLEDLDLPPRLDRLWAAAYYWRLAVEQRLGWVERYLAQGEHGPEAKLPSPRLTAPATSATDLDKAWTARLQEEVGALTQKGRTDAQARSLLQRHYHAWQRRLNALGPDDVLDVFLNALTGSLDPHAQYLNPRQAANLDISLRLYLDGVGLSFQLLGDEVVVETVFADSPASRSQAIQDGDRLVAIREGAEGIPVEVRDQSLDELAGLVRGKPGTDVHLTFVRYAGEQSSPFTVRLERAKIDLVDMGAKLDLVDMPGLPKPLGVITVPSFYQDMQATSSPTGRRVSTDVAALFARAQEAKASAVLLDLRQNNGGVLDEALLLASMLVPGEGQPLLQQHDAYGQVLVSRDTQQQQAWMGPLAVLVSRQTASAAEILAAALQDHGVAVIVGETTYGKGTYQALLDLDVYARTSPPQYGQVKLTVGEFYRITGQSIQQHGVEADMPFPITWGAQGLGEHALPHSLEPRLGQALQARPRLVLPASWADASQARRHKDNAWGGWWSYWQVNAEGASMQDLTVAPAWPEQDVWRDEALAVLVDAVRDPARWEPAEIIRPAGSTDPTGTVQSPAPPQ